MHRESNVCCVTGVRVPTVTNPDVQALFMASLTLQRMAEGGINDQLAGGFCRYSVDDYWMIPHFEKMLYDNAALLPVYAWAAQATGEPLFRDTAEHTAAGCCSKCRRLQAASTPASMQTPKATKANTTSGTKLSLKSC